MLNINDEIWKSVEGFYKMYEVSNTGKVRNSRNKIMSTYTINSGYQCLKFSVAGKRTHHLVHRLVAIAFCDKELIHTEVNHIDGDKYNNFSTNLEWCTSQENKQHGIRAGFYDQLFIQKNSLGKKHKPTCTSKYHNVSWDKSRNKWSASVRHEKVNWYPKRFKCEDEAAKHVNWILKTLKLTDRPFNIIN